MHANRSAIRKWTAGIDEGRMVRTFNSSYARTGVARQRSRTRAMRCDLRRRDCSWMRCAGCFANGDGDGGMKFGRSASVGETRRHRIEEEKKDGRKEDGRQQLQSFVRLGLDGTERRIEGRQPAAGLRRTDLGNGGWVWWKRKRNGRREVLGWQSWIGEEKEEWRSTVGG